MENCESDRGFAFSQSQVIHTKLKKNLEQIHYCYDARERKQQIIYVLKIYNK